MEALSDYFNEIHYQSFGFEPVIVLLIVIVLLMISALMSATEVAFFSLDPTEMEEIENRKDKKSKTILELKKKAEKLLATILILNNLINVSIVILISYMLSLIVSFGNALIVEFIFQTVIIAFILLVLADIIPKIYATQNALKVTLKVSPVLPFLIKIFSPFSAVLVGSTNIVNKRITKYRKTNISVSELSQALELTGKNIIEDKEILEGIVKFGNISVDEAMTPRINVVSVDMHDCYDAIIKKIAEFGYSRMPVYAGSQDDVKGILYIKDLLPHLNKDKNFRWQALIRSAYFVPETKKIDDLLKEFQQNKIHMAIVIDEFGGTSGIISMEDILEEIVGDISDEYDNDEKQYKKLNNNTYVFEAKILLNDFFRITGVNEDDFEPISSGADSLGGMILELTGEIPRENEKITFKHYVFEIVNADDRKIEKVKFHIKK